MTFISCQEEITQIIEPTQGEALKVNAHVTSLVQRTVTKDGSKDKADDDGPKEPGCCFKFGQCILDTVK